MTGTPRVPHDPRPCVLAFIDILGFRQHVAAAFKEDGDEKRGFLVEALATISRNDTQNAEALNARYRTTAFSDSVVLSAELSSNGISAVLRNAARLGAALLWRGIPCRGGVAEGLLIHDEEILVGPAMIAAYELERDAAVYPRIIVAESLCGQKETASWRLVQDQDGFWFVDVFQRISITGWQGRAHGADLPRVADFLRSSIRELEAQTHPGVLAKYRWLASKFNQFVQEKKLNLDLI